jgi:hypothetical protein
MNIHKKALLLWNKPIKEDFDEDEFAFLVRYIKRKKYKVKYGFYTKKSLSGKQVALVYDFIPNQPRKTGSENNWEIIHERDITHKEIEEHITFYYRSSYKRFLVFYYKGIEKLILDDKKLNAETPQKFIDECHKRQYSSSFQFKIEF